MTTELTTQQTALALPAEIATMAKNLDEAAVLLAGNANAEDGPFSTGLKTAMAMGLIEASLTDEIMQQWIMPLYGKSTGFLADRPAKPRKNKRLTEEEMRPYALPIVRTAVISHMAKGGLLTGNELNILAQRDYQTKAFFFRRLDEILGAGKWRLVHELPRMIKEQKTNSDGGSWQAIVGSIAKTTVTWTAGGQDYHQELEFAIKADGYSSSEQILGKADRKAAAWLFQRVTGLHVIDGDVQDQEPRVVEGRVVDPVDEAAGDEPDPPQRREEFQQPAKPQPAAAEPENKTEVQPELEQQQQQQQPDCDSQPRIIQPPCTRQVLEQVETKGQRVHPSRLSEVLATIQLSEDHAVRYLRACGWLQESQELADLHPKCKRWVIDNQAGFRMAYDTAVGQASDEA